MAKIVSTFGPRGTRPKYGITDEGETVELYSGPLIPQSNAGSTVYNWDFLNVSDADLPFALSNLGKYTGNSDEERVTWLKDQMDKMQAVALIYMKKIKEISADEPELSKVVSGALITIGGKLLAAAPPAGALVFGAGLVIKFLSSASGKKILEFKVKKITEWSATIKILQDQYILYANEIKSIENKKTFTILGLLALILVVMYRRSQD